MQEKACGVLYQKLLKSLGKKERKGVDSYGSELGSPQVLTGKKNRKRKGEKKTKTDPE